MAAGVMLTDHLAQMVLVCNVCVCVCVCVRVCVWGGVVRVGNAAGGPSSV